MHDLEYFNNTIKTYDFLISISKNAEFYLKQAQVAVKNKNLKESERLINEFFNIIDHANVFIPTIFIKDADLEFLTKGTIQILLVKNAEIIKIYEKIKDNSKALILQVAELTLDDLNKNLENDIIG